MKMLHVQCWWHTGLPFTWPVRSYDILQFDMRSAESGSIFHNIIPHIIQMCVSTMFWSHLALKKYWPTPKTKSIRYTYIILEKIKKRKENKNYGEGISCAVSDIMDRFLFWIYFSHSSVYKAFYLLRCSALQSGRSQPTFQKNILAGGLASLCTLIKVAIWWSKTLVDFHRTTWHYIPDDRNLHKYLLHLSIILIGAENFGLMVSVWRMGSCLAISWLI
jgi:hypothetical protein